LLKSSTMALLTRLREHFARCPLCGAAALAPARSVAVRAAKVVAAPTIIVQRLVPDEVLLPEAAFPLVEA
jgi:hypothetical protein